LFGDLTVSATLRKMMDFSEVTGDPWGASRPDLWSKARPSQRALSFRNLLINWLLWREVQTNHCPWRRWSPTGLSGTTSRS